MYKIIYSWHILSRIYPYIILSLLLLNCVPDSIHAQNKAMDQVLISKFKLRVKELALETQTITSNFQQDKEMSMISERIISKGKFYFRKERMLRWEYIDPFSYVIIINNDRISVKDENNVNHFNVSSNKVFVEINRIILGSIQGTLLNDEKNFKTFFFDSPASYVVKLYPSAANLKESLSEIVIYFDHKDFSVDQVEMIEPGGDKTRITFHNKIFNKPVADEKFSVQ